MSTSYGQLIFPVLGSHVLFSQGKLAKSGGPFDLAIDGPGFLAVTDARGDVAYVRGGAFSRAADGSLRDAQDMQLRGVRIPAGALAAGVDEDGTVHATFSNGTRAIGRIRLVEFAAPERLRATSGTRFEATTESGKPREIDPGGAGPKVRFGMLEQSNVTIVEAMMQILTAQRAYEANAKSVQAADEMLRIANNLQRS